MIYPTHTHTHTLTHAIDANVRITTDALQCLGLVFALAREYSDDGDTLDTLSAVAIMMSSCMGLVKVVYVLRQEYLERCGGVSRNQRVEPTMMESALLSVEMSVEVPLPNDNNVMTPVTRAPVLKTSTKERPSVFDVNEDTLPVKKDNVKALVVDVSTKKKPPLAFDVNEDAPLPVMKDNVKAPVVDASTKTRPRDRFPKKLPPAFDLDDL